MKLTENFKQRVRDGILVRRENYGGSDAKYAKSLGINPASYSKLKNGTIDGVIGDDELLRIGQLLNIQPKQIGWKVANTKVYQEIKDSFEFCQDNSQSMIMTDDWGIGKSFGARHIIKSMRNAFYLDCSQCKTKFQFIRELAKCIGADDRGRFIDIKTKLKYYLNVLETPIIILDDAGDLDYPAFLELKELWNGTEGSCAWYLIGDDSLENKINKGIQNKKVGYGAIFSRFSDEFIRFLPIEKFSRQHYVKKLLTDVAKLNLKDQSKLSQIVNKCLKKKSTLRYLTTLIHMSNEQAAA